MVIQKYKSVKMDMINNAMGREIGTLAKSEEEVLQLTIKAINSGKVIYRRRPKGSVGEIPIPVMKAYTDVDLFQTFPSNRRLYGE
jgi:hypothetical protein